MIKSEASTIPYKVGIYTKTLQMLGIFTLLPLMFAGPFLYEGSWKHWIVAWFFWAFIVSSINAIGMHLGLCHKAMTMRLWVQRFIGFFFTSTALTSPLGFTLVHFMHHKFADTEKDPSSPKYTGFWKAAVYSNQPPPTGEDLRHALMSAKHLLRDKWQISYLRDLHLWILIWPTIVLTIGLLLGNPLLWLYWAWVMPCGLAIFGVIFATFLHPYDKPINIRWVEYIGILENMHKLHHENMKSYDHGPIHRSVGRILSL
jgi:fatty-acid desaturase